MRARGVTTKPPLFGAFYPAVLLLCLALTFRGADGSMEAITNDTRVSWEPSVLVLSVNASLMNIEAFGRELALTIYAVDGCFLSVLDVTRLATAASPAEGQLTRNDLMFSKGAPFCGALPTNKSTLPMQYRFHPTAVAFHRGQGQQDGTPPLLVADSVPHSNIFHVARMVGGASSAQVRRIAGSPACDFEAYRPPNNSVATNMSIGWTFALVSDGMTGNVYITQAFAIVVIADSGAASYYFGNATREGSKGDAFNYDVPRWDATTLSPSQMAIDARRRVMYVAESGMSTVRAIDMTTGRATVVLGRLTYDTFPPVVCARDNCTTADIQLISPRGVATHYAAALQQTWLFVSDFTAAVIYRVVIETGVVTTVAGTLLVSCCNKGLVRSVGTLSIYYDATNHRGSLFAVTRGISRYSWIEPAVAVPSTHTDINTASEAAVTASVFIGGIGAGIAVTEAVTMLVLAGTQCTASTSTPKTNILQSIFFFASSRDGGPPPSETAWLLLGAGALFATVHVGVVAVLRFVRQTVSHQQDARWMFAMESARFPAFFVIFSDVVMPLAVFSAAEATTAEHQTSDERASAAASMVVSLLVATAMRYMFVAAPFRPLERLVFVPRMLNPLSLGDDDELREREGDPLAEGTLSPRGLGLGMSFSSVSLTSSFASLLGVGQHNKHRTATMQALEASMSAYAAEGAQVDAAPRRNSAHQGCGSEYVMPRGYWAPPQLTHMWGPLFSKTMESFWYAKFVETAISLVTAVFSGVAASYRQRAACQALMGTLAALFFAAAIAVAALRPFRHPSENAMMPVSYALLGVMCILRAIPGEPVSGNAVALDVLQIAHSGVVAVKTVLHLCVWWADTDVRQLHVVRSKAPNSPVTGSSPVTTRSSPLGSPRSSMWSRQPSDDDRLFALPLQGNEGPTTVPVAAPNNDDDDGPSQRAHGFKIEDFADPMSLMEGGAGERAGLDERAAARANQAVSLVAPQVPVHSPRVTSIVTAHTNSSDSSDSEVEL